MPFKGVMRSTPPKRLEASPRLDTVTSRREPGLTDTGIWAVTMTAATFLGFRVARLTDTPMFSSRLTMDWMVNCEPALSPVPDRPTTRP